MGISAENRCYAEGLSLFPCVTQRGFLLDLADDTLYELLASFVIEVTPAG